MSIRDAAEASGVPSGAAEAAAAPEEDAQAVGRRVAIGSAFMVAGRLAIRGIGVVSTLILVRLLLPEDFGLIGLAASTITIAEVLTQTNLGLAVIRRHAADRALYDAAWTFNLLRCLLLGGFLACTASWQAGLLGDPRIAPILVVVGSTIALDGLASAGVFRLQRELRFDLVFRLELVTKLAAFLATIALAVALRNYWCLVLGNLLAKVLAIPYSYWLAPHRPRLSLASARELLHFSKWMLAANACGAVDGQAANIAIGRLVGLPSLGVWQIAWQIAALPVTELAVPIRGPIYAGYAKVRHDRALLRRHFLGGFGLLCAVVAPLSVGVALVAAEIERLALGPAFAGAAPLIALCALYASADAMAHFTFNLFVVLDAQRRMVAAYVLLVLVRVPAVVAGALLAGAEGAGAALVATAVLNALVWHAQVAKLLGHGLSDVWSEVWRSLAAAAAMAAAVTALRGVLPQGGGDVSEAVLNLAALAGCGAFVHVATQGLLWRLAGAPEGAERRLLSMLARVIARLRTGRTHALSR